MAVGSLFDGDVERLAHFCEHMLFLGTEKYPDEQAYSKYLNQNGGRSNAYTDMDHTCYYFDVNFDKLEGVYVYVYVCVCVFKTMCTNKVKIIYLFLPLIYIHTHTHTHTHIPF